MPENAHRTAPRFPGIAVGVSLIGVSMLLLARLQYAMPYSARYLGPIDLPGMYERARWLAWRPVPVGVSTFEWAFRGLVLLTWLGYLLVLYWGYRHGVSRPTAVLTTAFLIAAVLAVVFPPSLTHDLYAYLAYGRLAPLYGLNPYAHSLNELAGLGDPVAIHYLTPAPTVYGPFWTLVSSGIASLLRHLPVTVQLMAFNLIGVAALAGAAFAALAIARVWDVRYATLAAVAVALNPVLLLEGPCNGHNDVLMIALMLAGIALVLRGSWKTGYVILGLSVGVKFITAAIVPWVIIEQVRFMPLRDGVRRAAAAACLVLSAFLLPFIPYVSALGAASGVESVYQQRSSNDLVALAGVAGVVVGYVAATVWVWRGHGDRLAPAWTAWSAAAALWLMPGTMLPWYVTWPTSLTFTRWDRRQIVLSAACGALGLYWMLHYVVLRGGG